MNASVTGIKRWLTAKEMADAVLPGVPVTESGVVRAAKRAAWPSRERTGRGGGREYPLEALPPAARAEWVVRHMGAVAVPEALRRQPSDADEPLSGPAAEARDARMAILTLVDRYIAETGAPKRMADRHFCDLYNLGRLDVADWIRTRVKRLSPATLFRWRAARRDGETRRLGIDKGAARRRRGVLDVANDGEVKTFVLGLIAANPQLSARHIHDALKGSFPEGITVLARGGEIARVPVPPMRTVQWAVSRWKDELKVELAAITHPDAYKSKYRLSGRNSYAHVRRLNQLWMIDASPADALCLDGRWSVYVAIDVHPRRLMVLVSRTPRAAAVCALMRRAILAWGVPEQVMTDNGSDFTARQTTMLMANLGIDVEHSRPFTPEEKSFIERAIGTLQHDLMRLLPGFVGHSVTDRKRIEERRAFAQRIGADDADTFAVELTGAQLQAWCDEWCASYLHRPHAGLGRRTPFELVTASREPMRTVDERALDMLLMPLATGNGLRTVGKTGIRVDGNWYLAPHIMPGRQVMVRMDPANLGRLYLYSPAGDEFVGIAECPALVGIDPKEATRAAQAEQDRLIKERTAPIRKVAKTFKGTKLADLVLRQRAKEAGKLVELPKPRVAHTADEIEAALMATQPPAPAMLTDDAAALHAEMVAAFEREVPAAMPAQPTTSVASFPEQPKHRFRRAVELERRLAAGGGVSAAETGWLAGYQKSDEYSAFRDMRRDFGDEWLFG